MIYKIKDGVYYKTLSAVAKEPFLLKKLTTEAFKTSLPLNRGGEGQPVFAGGEMFIGAEFPTACNGFTADQLDILQNPYVRLEKGGVFSSFGVVFGFRGADTLERSFEKHVKSHALKKSGTLKIYSDWGLHDELSDNIRLSDEMVKDMISRIKSLKRENGVNFDYYLMDAFWWEDGEEYIGFKKSIWPDGISLEYDRERLNKSSENKPWSGLSWAILKKTDKPGGETVCEIENKGADKITVLWKEKT